MQNAAVYTDTFINLFKLNQFHSIHYERHVGIVLKTWQSSDHDDLSITDSHNASEVFVACSSADLIGSNFIFEETACISSFPRLKKLKMAQTL